MKVEDVEGDYAAVNWPEGLWDISRRQEPPMVQPAVPARSPSCTYLLLVVKRVATSI